MHVKSVYPLVITPHLEDSKAFYKALGFQAVFQNEFYLHMQAGDGEGPEVAFLLPHHPTQSAPFLEPYGGQGSCITLTVADARTAAEEVAAAGLKITLPLRDEPWGQRHFALTDPNGVAVDVVEQIEVSDATYLEGYAEAARQNA